MSLIKKTIKASLWSSLTEIIAKVISPLTFLVLTRILSPDDFGLVAVATTILSLAQVISDMGTSKVIIQRNNEGNMVQIYNVAFVFNLVVGTILYFTFLLGADHIARLFNQPQSASIIRVMALQILFYSLSSVQNALRKRSLDFKFLFWTRLITILTPAFISIPIAFAGGGVWAIVMGTIVGSFLSTCVLWYFSDWHPRWYFNIVILKQLFSKSIWNTVEQLFVWIPIALDTYLLSNYFSVADLGYYTTSKTMFATATGLLLAPLMPVLFSSFSRMDKDKIRFNEIIYVSQKIVFTIAAFMGVAVYSFREYIEMILFNDRWSGISSIFGLLFLIMGFEYFYSVIVEGLRAKGYFKQIAMNTMLSIMLAIPFLFYSVSWGITGYVIARGIALYFYFPGIFYLSKMKCNITFYECLRRLKFELIILSFFLLISIIINGFELTNVCKFVLLFLSFLIVLSIFLYKEHLLIKNLLNKIKTQ